MCGIAGAVLNQANASSPVEAMVGEIRYRGPDELSFYADRSLHMGFSRLSIVDPADGHQPVASEDGAIVALCNGEIYNHELLRDQLSKDGHSFNSMSDAEVLPHLYETLDEGVFTECSGMFAIALYDKRNQKLILARDPLGIKPLYYLETACGFYFASEIKCFLQVPEFRPDVDRRALDRLLTFSHIPGDRCLLAGVRSVAPGHFLTLDLNTRAFSFSCFYRTPRTTRKGLSVPTMEEAASSVRGLLDQAVGARLMSDVPWGVALSGGLDSASVLASVVRQTETRPMTFSFDVGAESEDARYAEMLAAHFRTDHRVESLDGYDIASIVRSAVWHTEEPISSGEIPTLGLALLVSKHVRVLLTGDGADELFAGYLKFKPLKLFSFLPLSLLSWGYVRGVNGFTRLERGRFANSYQKEFVGPNGNRFLDEELRSGSADVMNRFLRYEVGQQLPNNQLMRLDKLMMAQSVEARVPFLDSKLVDYVTTLPSSFKLRGLQEKTVLKEAMKNRLPNEILRRKKFPFANPARSLLRGTFQEVCREEFRADRSTLAAYFRPSSLDKMFQLIGKTWLSVPEMKLLQIYFFLKWHQLFIGGGRPSKNAVAAKAVSLAG